MSEICDEALANLYLYLDRELDGVSAEGIRSHLDDCPPCGKAFAFEERLRLVVRQRLAEDVPQEVIDRIRGALRAEGSP